MWIIKKNSFKNKNSTKSVHKQNKIKKKVNTYQFIGRVVISLSLKYIRPPQVCNSVQWMIDALPPSFNS